LAGLFLYAQAVAPWAEASFWEERRGAAQSLRQGTDGGMPSMPLLPPVSMEKNFFWSAPETQTAGLSSAAANLPSWLSSVPTAYGEIQKVSLSARASGPFVVLIQDAHQIHSAQLNIAHMLAHVEARAKAQGLGPVLIGLEGAAGALHLTPYRRTSLKDVHEYTAEFLLRQGMISGPEYHGMLAPETPRLWGVEDPDLYVENVEAFQKSLPKKDEFQREIQALRNALEAAKESIYNLELWALDKNLAAYHKGELDLLRFVRHLTANDPDIGARFPQTGRLLEALALEESLDFKRVESDRAGLLQTLVQRLSRENLDRLLSASVAYRAGEIGYIPFYSFLRKLAEEHRVTLSDYPDFNRYVSYVLLAERIDRRALFDELEGLKEAAIDRLARTPAQKEMMRLANDLRLLERLADQGLSPQEWANYENRREALARVLPRTQALVESVGQLGPALKIPLEDFLPSFERFYTAAFRRNDALVENLLARVRQTGARAAVLVAGGFHTPGVEDVLRGKGISFVTLMPKVGQIPPGSAYLDVFTAHRTPLERIMLGERLYVVPPSPMAQGLGRVAKHRAVQLRAAMAAVLISLAVASGVQAIAEGEIRANFGGRAEVEAVQRPGNVWEVTPQVAFPDGETIAPKIFVNEGTEAPADRLRRPGEAWIPTPAGRYMVSVVVPERLLQSEAVRTDETQADVAPSPGSLRRGLGALSSSPWVQAVVSGSWLTNLSFIVYSHTGGFLSLERWGSFDFLLNAGPMTGLLPLTFAVLLTNVLFPLAAGAAENTLSFGNLFVTSVDALGGANGLWLWVFVAGGWIPSVNPALWTVAGAALAANRFRNRRQPGVAPEEGRRFAQRLREQKDKAAAVIEAVNARPDEKHLLDDLAVPALATRDSLVEAPIGVTDALLAIPLETAETPTEWKGGADDHLVTRVTEDLRLLLNALIQNPTGGSARALVLTYYAVLLGVLGEITGAYGRRTLLPMAVQDLARLAVLPLRHFFGTAAVSTADGEAHFIQLLGAMSAGRALATVPEAGDAADQKLARPLVLNFAGIEKSAARDFHLNVAADILAAQHYHGVLGNSPVAVLYDDESTREAFLALLSQRISGVVDNFIWVRTDALQDMTADDGAPVAAATADGWEVNLAAFLASPGIAIATTRGLNVFSPPESSVLFVVDKDLEGVVSFIVYMLSYRPLAKTSDEFLKFRESVLRAARSA